MLVLWNLRGYALEWLYLLCLHGIPIKKDVGSGLPKIVTFLKDGRNCHASFWLWCFEGKVCMILIKMDAATFSYPCFQRNCCNWQSHGSVAAFGIFQIMNAHMYYYHHFINSISLLTCFSPQRAILRECKWSISKARSTKRVTRYKIL
jgi:hypothetical protein